MHPEAVPWPGYTPISDRIYLRNSEEKAEAPSPDEPSTIIIFGWGDGQPKHVSKYADGYHDLFPSARILVVISTILQGSNQPLESRVEAMMPIINLVFPTPSGSITDENEERVLLQAMSNTGAIFAAAALVAYQRCHGPDKQFPHKLLVCDSTPGGLDFFSQVGRWSRAMTAGTSASFPWPVIITQALWYAFLCVNWAWEKLRGTEPSGAWANRILNDQRVSSADAARLSVYSKEDAIIWWEDLEINVAEAKRLGYSIYLEMFHGSPHVGHMRLNPSQYWQRISTCWGMVRG